MIRPGICSITLRQFDAGTVIDHCRRGGLEGIEWWGKDHVPAGDARTAGDVGRSTRDAGLEVAAYGSYYRAGVSEQAGHPFADVLESARALGAPTIRVWAGAKDFEDATEEEIATVVGDANRIADMAGAHGIRITFEFHTDSLTNRSETAVLLAGILPHGNIDFSWQPQHGYRLRHNLFGLRQLLPRLGTIHVFHWTIGAWECSTVNETVRPIVHPEDFHIHPLADGADNWREYLRLAASSPKDHWALLEFAKDDAPGQVRADAETLHSLL